MDSLEVRAAMKAPGSQMPPPQDLHQDHDSSVVYPLGATPSWREVQKSIERNPLVLMRLWEFMPPQDVPHVAAEKLFISWAWQMWCGINRKHRQGDWNPSGQINLEQAMALWSVDQVHEHLREIQWEALSKPEWKVGGRSKDSFRDRWQIYFPDRTIEPPKGSSWGVLFKHPWYIAEYHERLKSQSTLQNLDMQISLGNLFHMVQSLPSSLRCSSSAMGKTWEHAQGRTIMLTNPDMYRVETVGKRVTTRRAGIPAAIAPRLQNEEDLLFGFGANQADQREIKRSLRVKQGANTLASQRNRNRSGKSKNARRPPLPASAPVRTPAVSDQEAAPGPQMAHTEDQDDVTMQADLSIAIGDVIEEDAAPAPRISPVEDEEEEVSMHEGQREDIADETIIEVSSDDEMDSRGWDESIVEIFSGDEDEIDYQGGDDDTYRVEGDNQGHDEDEDGDEVEEEEEEGRGQGEDNEDDEEDEEVEA